MTAAAWILACVFITGSGIQLGAAVVCLGSDGHVDVESFLASCCTSKRSDDPGAGTRFNAGSSSCGDCVDVQLKAPPLTSREDWLASPGSDTERPVCGPRGCCDGGNRLSKPTELEDQHWRAVTSLSSVVLLT